MKNQWDQRYDRSDYYYGTAANDFLREQSHLFFNGARVLCLAEGEGRNAVYLAKLGCKVTAVDISQVGLSKLQALASKDGLSIEAICADLVEYKIQENSWDFIVSIWCHLPSVLRKKVYNDSALGLASNGYFILEAYTPNQIPLKTGGPQDPDLTPTKMLLEKELAGLHFLHCRELEREIHEGLGHNGMSAVVQVLGRKEA